MSKYPPLSKGNHWTSTEKGLLDTINRLRKTIILLQYMVIALVAALLVVSVSTWGILQ